MSSGGGKFTEGQADLSTDQIRAHGNITTRIAIIRFVAFICGILAIGGLIAFFVDPASSKDIWVIIGPIISAAVSGTVAFFAGKDNNE